jgi:hypothetical protein
MEKTVCLYAEKGCLFTSPSCSGDNSDCGERNHREKLDRIPCPIMQGLGFKNCSCDIPNLRALVPSGKECSCNGKCTVREIGEAKSLVVAREKPSLADRAKAMVVAVALRRAI